MKKAKVGDFVGFKCDIEQTAEVVEVRNRRGWDGKTCISYLVKAPPDGFSGNYIGRLDFHEIDHDDCW